MTTTLHTSDFVKQNAANKTNKLPIWPFWDINHFTGFKIHSRSKIKNTPHFCLKRTKGKEYKNHRYKILPLLSQQDKGKQSI
jgi:hypothetical protein